jgi:hypothetical protein
VKGKRFKVPQLTTVYHLPFIASCLPVPNELALNLSKGRGELLEGLPLDPPTLRLYLHIMMCLAVVCRLNLLRRTTRPTENINIPAVGRIVPVRSGVDPTLYV